MPVPSYGGVDERWVEGGESFVVEGVFGKGAGEIVFDEDVAFLDESVEDGDSSRIVEGEAKGLLVAVYLGSG